MKANEIEELKKFLSNKDLANLFHVYPDDILEEKNAHVFNIMRTIYMVDLDDIPKSFFTYYQVVDNDTWNLISYKLYGTIELWWLILKMNSIKDPLFEPEKDTYLRYISKEDANEIINTIKTS